MASGTRRRGSGKSGAAGLAVRSPGGRRREVLRSPPARPFRSARRRRSRSGRGASRRPRPNSDRERPPRVAGPDIGRPARHTRSPRRERRAGSGERRIGLSEKLSAARGRPTETHREETPREKRSARTLAPGIARAPWTSILKMRHGWERLVYGLRLPGGGTKTNRRGQSGPSTGTPGTHLLVRIERADLTWFTFGAGVSLVVRNVW